jgi:hypothetical protein
MGGVVFAASVGFESVAAYGAFTHIGCVREAAEIEAACGGSGWLQPIKLKPSAPMTSALTTSLPLRSASARNCSRASRC